MKKVMIGILILIPIFILLIVALVSNLLQLEAWIAVDDMILTYKSSDRAVTSLELYLDVQDGTVFNMLDWVQVSVFPEKANNYSLDWTISNVVCMDDEYQRLYEQYLADPSGVPVHPAASLVDGEGRDADSNTSGDFKVNAYCNFDVTVRAETVTRNFFVNIMGDTVRSVSLSDLQGGDSAVMTMGESRRLCASYVPMDSIITNLQFFSDDDSVLAVDENGVVTALRSGVATVTAAADKYNSDGELVYSNAYLVTVREAVSKYGDSVTLPKNVDGRYEIALLGLIDADIYSASCSGCSAADGYLVMAADSATILFGDGRSLNIYLCGQDDITIEHSSLFDEASGYVLSVGEFGLRLRARYASDLDDRSPSVTWRSDNEAVATVDENGVVTGLSDGVATIEAACGGATASVRLNVKRKTALLRLMTSNEALEAGLARQTVFASERYTTTGDGGAFETEPNSVLIRIQTEPEDVTSEQLSEFYDRYIFEIEQGGEYARFDGDVANKLVFDGKALEGKGLVDIVVKVTAKYPRFETGHSHTTDSVTLSAVYGAEVSTFAQAFDASGRQREYFEREDNFIEGEDIDVLDAPDGEQYHVRLGNSARRTYAIVLAADICPDEGEKLDAYLNDGVCLVLMGDLYGNGHTVYAKPSNVTGSSSHLVRIATSGVTVSNARVCEQDIELNSLDSSTFKDGYCVIVEDLESLNYRAVNVKLEYCIIENAKGGVYVRNSDVALDGCIVRNISTCGVNAFARVYDYHLVFPRIALNNCIFSSVISFNIGINHEQYTVEKSNMGRFSSMKNAEATRDNVYASREESYRWAEENLVPKRYVPCIDQTGFLDIYGWQNATKVNLIDAGDKTYNQLLSLIVGPLIENHPLFEPCICDYNGIKYMHLGIMSAGINLPMLGERTFTQANFEDDRFVKITMTGMETDVPGLPTDVKTILDLFIDQLSLDMYNYKKDASLGPASTYELNGKLIDHLHGK